jgi:hypothetical protein
MIWLQMMMHHHHAKDEAKDAALCEEYDWELYLLSPQKVEDFYHAVAHRHPEHKYQLFFQLFSCAFEC